MNKKANRQKWIEALRSGEFKQTTNKLRNRKGFCCLGVACEVFKRETGIGEWTDVFGDMGFRVDWEDRDSSLPGLVMEWLGLRTPVGKFSYVTKTGLAMQTLIRLNDIEGSSFDEIASVIESEPEGLVEGKKPSLDLSL